MEDDSESKQSRILSFLDNQNDLKSLSRRPWFCSQQSHSKFRFQIETLQNHTTLIHTI